MKILFCKNSFVGPISGADEIAVTYAIKLKAAGHTTSVLLVQTPAERDPLVLRLRDAGVPLDTLASPGFSTSLTTARFIAIRAMRVLSPVRNLILTRSRNVVFNLLQQYKSACCDYLKRTRPDVMHVLTPDPGAVMLIRAAHEMKIPIIYQEVGIPFHPPGFEEMYERFVAVLPLCSEVTTLSPALVRELSRVLPHISPAKVLPLIGLNHNGGPKNARKSEVVSFGFAARLEYLKGPIRLLEAFTIAHETCTQIELRLAGEGSQRREFINKSRKAGLEAKCKLLGVYTTVEERTAFMNSLDVFVLPSLTEGTPNVIVEAMAQGKPIIATNVGGVPDLVTDDVGILVPCDDIQALADAMVRLASDSDLRERMGKAARRRYEELFTPEAVLPVLEHLYQDVIRAHANGSASTNGNSATPLHPWIR